MSHTILIVDDEVKLLDVLGDMLGQIGSRRGWSIKELQVSTWLVVSLIGPGLPHGADRAA